MAAKKDAGQADVQKKQDEAEDKGFIGQQVDPRPNDDYSIKTGPDSPPAVEDGRTRVDQIHADPEA